MLQPKPRPTFRLCKSDVNKLFLFINVYDFHFCTSITGTFKVKSVRLFTFHWVLSQRYHHCPWWSFFFFFFCKIMRPLPYWCCFLWCAQGQFKVMASNFVLLGDDSLCHWNKSSLIRYCHSSWPVNSLFADIVRSGSNTYNIFNKFLLFHFLCCLLTHVSVVLKNLVEEQDESINEWVNVNCSWWMLVT